jgi:hypothetical protein
MKYLKLFENFEDNQPVIETLETILSLVKSGKRLSSKLNGGTVMDLHDGCDDPQVMEILSNAVDVISQEIEGTKVDASHFIDTDELEGLVRILKANPEKSEEGMKVERFSNFVKESHSKSVHISEEEMNLFSQEAALQELITKNKITLKNGEVLFDENDEETKQLLDQYLEIPGKIQESIFDDEEDYDGSPIGIDNLATQATNGLVYIFSPLETDMVEDWNNDKKIQKFVEEERLFLSEIKYDEWSIYGIEGDKEVRNYIIRNYSY